MLMRQAEKSRRHLYQRRQPLSGYHARDERPPPKRTQEDARLCVAIRAAHLRTRQTYGAERLQPELKADGFPAGVGRIKQLRQEFKTLGSIKLMASTIDDLSQFASVFFVQIKPHWLLFP